MDWREKLIWVALGLVLISWGLELFSVWPVLAEHLNRLNWAMLVLIHPAGLLALMSAYSNAPQGSKGRGPVLLAALIVIISWSQDFALMGKIAGH